MSTPSLVAPAGRHADQWAGPHQELFRATLRLAARRTPTHRAACEEVIR